jgi:hypothetical protein
MTYNRCDIPLLGCDGYFEKAVGNTVYLLRELCYKANLDGNHSLHLFCEINETLTSPNQDNQITVSNRRHNEEIQAFSS